MSQEYQWVLAEYKKAKSRASSRSGKKAKAHVNKMGHERKITKGKLDNLTFQVNPTTMKFKGGAKWINVDSPSRYSPFWQAGCDLPEVITFDLYFNEWILGKKVNGEQFVAELERMRNQHFAVKFIWGKRVYDVLVTNYEMEAESFNPDLTIREATVSLELTVQK